MAANPKGLLLQFRKLTDATTLTNNAVSACLQQSNFDHSHQYGQREWTESPGFRGQAETTSQPGDRKENFENRLLKLQDRFKPNQAIPMQHSASMPSLETIENMAGIASFKHASTRTMEELSTREDMDCEDDAPSFPAGSADEIVRAQRPPTAQQLNLNLINAIERAADRDMELDIEDDWSKDFSSDTSDRVYRSMDEYPNLVTDDMLLEFAYAGTETEPYDSKSQSETEKALELSILTAQKEQNARQAKERKMTDELQRGIEASINSFDGSQNYQRNIRDEITRQAEQAMQNSFSRLETDANFPTAGTSNIKTSIHTAKTTL